MDFYLRYRGPLPSVTPGKTRITEKHKIRIALSSQLEDLWSKAPQLNTIKGRLDEIPVRQVKGGRVTYPEERIEEFDYYCSVEFRNCQFIPLITMGLELQCHLELLFLRREDPGAIVHGGDLDNRLKTLFDGLRIPLAENEIPDNIPEMKRIFCLTEEDSLITKINIETGRLLGPLQDGENENDVDLSIHVIAKVSWPIFKNIPWFT